MLVVEFRMQVFAGRRECVASDTESQCPVGIRPLRASVYAVLQHGHRTAMSADVSEVVVRV